MVFVVVVVVVIKIAVVIQFLVLAFLVRLLNIFTQLSLKLRTNYLILCTRLCVCVWGGGGAIYISTFHYVQSMYKVVSIILNASCRLTIVLIHLITLDKHSNTWIGGAVVKPSDIRLEDAEFAAQYRLPARTGFFCDSVDGCKATTSSSLLLTYHLTD